MNSMLGSNPLLPSPSAVSCPAHVTRLLWLSLLCCLAATSSAQVAVHPVANGTADVQRWHVTSVENSSATVLAITSDAVWSLDVAPGCPSCLDDDHPRYPGIGGVLLATMGDKFAESGSYVLLDDSRLLTCSTSSSKGVCSVYSLPSMEFLMNTSMQIQGSKASPDSLAMIITDDNMILVASGVTRGNYNVISLIDATNYRYKGYRPGYPDKPQFRTSDLPDTADIRQRSAFTLHDGTSALVSLDNWHTRSANQPLTSDTRHYATRVTFLCTSPIKNWMQQLQQAWVSCGRHSVLSHVTFIEAKGHLATSLGAQEGDHVFVGTFGTAKSAFSLEIDESKGGAVCSFHYKSMRSWLKNITKNCIDTNGYMCKSFQSNIHDQCSTVRILNNTCLNNIFICTEDIFKGHILYESAVDFMPSIALFNRKYYNYPTKEDTFLFASTNKRKIFKLHVNGQGKAEQYGEFSIDTRSAFMPFSESFGSDLVVMATKRELVNLAKHHCSVHLDCASCKADKTCGWCVLSNRCSVYEQCDHGDKRDRFITDTCPVVSVSQPRIDIRNTRNVEITVSQLPILESNEYYEIVYDVLSPEKCSSQGDKLTCPLPENYDLANQVSKNISVSIRFVSTTFASTSLVFFDCQSMSSCTQCTLSSFTCAWCPTKNSCRSLANLQACSNASHESNKCPMVISSDILLPANYSKLINVKGLNLINDARYKCRINSTIYDASWINSQSVNCGPILLNYNSNKYSIKIKVELFWMDSFKIDKSSKVSVYKCSAMAEDCSSCTAFQNDFRSKYSCAWCTTVCEYRAKCNSNSVETKCALPTVDSMNPSSGVIEGGQYVDIIGNNLGIKYSDIKDSVQIGGKTCITNEREYVISKRIRCKVPSVSAPKKAEVSIKIANRETVKLNSFYMYKDPKVQYLTPANGPVSGGTRLSISGSQLQTGNIVFVNLDNDVCEIEPGFSYNDTFIECSTMKSAQAKFKELSIKFDGKKRDYVHYFNFTADPNITDVQPRTNIISGGKIIKVEGSNFNSIAKPEMYFISNKVKSKHQECTKISNVLLHCLAPSMSDLMNTSNAFVSQRKKRSINSEVSIGFKMDAVQSVTELDFTFKIYPDPIFYKFKDDPYILTGENLIISGKNFDGISLSDVRLYLGERRCNLRSLSSSSGNLFCRVDIDPALVDTEVEVKVDVGKWITIKLGTLRYSGTDKINRLFLIVGVVCGFFLIAIIILISVFFARKTSAASRQFKKMQIQLDSLESNVRNECKQAFAELQTEVSDFQDDVHHKGIPFRDFQTYTFKILFPTYANHPIFERNKNPYQSEVNGNLMKFAQLLNSKKFLMIFIKTLERQKAFQIRDKSFIASLLTVIFHDKMDYATDILTNLLSDLIDHSIETKNPKLLLRRHESVVEKFLTNWMSLCMYDYLKNDAGKTLYLLFKSIKYQSEKGPVDAITGEAKYSLSDNTLLRENIDYKQLTLMVHCEAHLKPVPCRVLDCDTITQTKCKVLDAVYRNQAYSRRPTVHQVELHWITGGHGSYISLEDDDISTVSSCAKLKRLNTLQHYRLPANAKITLIEHPESTDDVHKINGRIEIMSGLVLNAVVEDGMDSWHLVKKDLNPHRSQKVISEIFLTRLLSTKGTLQQFIDDLFLTILDSNIRVPATIKFLFDFFDESARKHNITDPDVVHAWKSNSLPLRFWVNILKNPDFIFDVNKTSIIDSCLSVVASSFMDSCSLTEHRLGKDSPSNKLLFARDIPRYKSLIKKYFQRIREMPSISTDEILSHMRHHSEQNHMDLNVHAALKELLSFARQYSFEILVNLQDDSSAKKLRLATKFDEVLGNTGIISNF